MTDLEEVPLEERTRHSVQSGRVDRFARNMRELREVRGWSVRRLSDELAAIGQPVPCSVLTNLENKRRERVTLDEAFAIVKVLNTTLAWLCDYDGPSCTHCQDNPPAGYACLVCKADKDLRFKPHKEELE